MPSPFTSPADATDAPNDSLEKLPVMMASALAAVRCPNRGTVEEKHLSLERAPSNVSARERMSSKPSPLRSPAGATARPSSSECSARDDRVGIGRSERAAQRTVEEVNSARLDSTRIVASRAYNDVIETVVIHVAGGGNGEPEVVAERLRRDDRIRVGGIDVPGEGTVEEIGAPREAGYEVVGRRADDYILDTVTIDVAGRCDLPSKSSSAPSPVIVMSAGGVVCARRFGPGRATRQA